MIRLEHISKRCGATLALDDVSLSVAPGERLAIVGENGAGKTTLMNVLTGLYTPDTGRVLFDGAPMPLGDPKAASKRGVGMVHQHFALVPTLTVAENVVLGHEPGSFGVVDLAAARSVVRAAAEKAGFDVDPDAVVGELSVGSRQKVEILKALARGATTLILDEPTAVLTPQESRELFAVTKALSARGTAVVLISHKLPEVLAFATRIAVLRKGRLIRDDVVPETLSVAQLAELMVGQGIDLSLDESPMTLAHDAPTVLALESVTADGVHGVTLQVREGEVVGIAGVDGNGQRELAEVITGLRPWSSGTVSVRGRPLHRLEPREAQALGIAHVPEDRLRRALVSDFSSEENLALGRHRSAWASKGPLIDARGRRDKALALLGANDVRPPEPTARSGDLSGGNQQKLVVARELDGAPALVVAVQPTRGLDFGAVAAVRRRLRAAASRGAGVLVISLDLDEVRALSDTIVVMAHGRVTGTFARGEADEGELGRRMLASGASA